METNNKQRDAMELAKATFETLIQFQGDEYFVKTWARLGRDAMVAALAEPQRNCDLYETADEARQAWLDDTGNWDELGSPRLDLYEWLFAAGTEKEGGNK